MHERKTDPRTWIRFEISKMTLTEHARLVEVDGSFFCSGHIRKARQAEDHAEALPMKPGTPPLTCPFREIQVAGYAHLHTTLNKSRDEKLNRRRVGRGSDSGGRAGVMGRRRATGKHSRAGSQIDASKMAPPPGLEPGTYRLTAERSAN